MLRRSSREALDEHPEQIAEGEDEHDHGRTRSSRSCKRPGASSALLGTTSAPLHWPGGRLEEISNCDAQRAGEVHERVHGRVAPSFEAAQFARIDVELFGEFLLREFALAPDLDDALSDAPADAASFVHRRARSDVDAPSNRMYISCLEVLLSGTRMRSGAIASLVIVLLALIGACSSDVEASPSSCPDLARCYTMTMSVPASAPAECSPGKSADVPADWRELTEDGSYLSLNTGCRGTLTGCTFNVECPSINGDPLKMTFTFSDAGYAGSATYRDCSFDIAARRSACAEDAPTTDGGFDVAPDARVCSCGTKECGNDACGKSCGTCSDGYVCNSVGICLLDPDGLWSVTAMNGSVAPGSWDGLDATPEPFVCVYGLTSPSPSCTTKPAPSTYSPSWNQIVVPSARARDLLKGLDFEVKDEDTTAAGADDICTRVTKPVKEADLKSGTFTTQCAVGTSISTVVFKFIAL